MLGAAGERFRPSIKSARRFACLSRGKNGAATACEQSTARRTSMPTPDRSRDARRRGLGKNSGRQAGGSYFAIQFGSDELGPEDLRLALTGRGLHIQRQKGMKDVVGEEEIGRASCRDRV